MRIQQRDAAFPLGGPCPEQREGGGLGPRNELSFLGRQRVVETAAAKRG